jgi:hypothetical protein
VAPVCDTIATGHAIAHIAAHYAIAERSALIARHLADHTHRIALPRADLGHVNAPSRVHAFTCDRADDQVTTN